MFSGAKMSHFWQQPSQNQTYYIPDEVSTCWHKMAKLDSTTKSSPLKKLSNFLKLQISALQLTDYKKIFTCLLFTDEGVCRGDWIFTPAFELQQNNDVQQWMAKTCRSSWDVISHIKKNNNNNYILVEVVLLYIHCAHSLLRNTFCNANLFHKKEINTANRLSGELRWHLHELWLIICFNCHN